MAEKDKKGIVGIDIGGTKTLLALFDEKFKVLSDVKIKTQADKGEERFTEKLLEAVESLMKAAKNEDLGLVGIGAGCAGLIDDEKGVIALSPNIPFLKDYPLSSRLAKATGLRAVLNNDVHSGLYGEHQLGAAKGFANVLGVFLGTGIGGAIIMDNRLYRGAKGLAGDIGRYLVDPLGPLAGSQRHGVLDDVASRTAIAAEAAALAAKQWAPELYKEAGADLQEITSGVLAKAIEKGDKKVEELVRSRARIVGIVLSNLADFLAPDMVVLGGGLVEAMPKLIVKEVEDAMREHISPALAKHVKVAAAELMGHAVCAGAAKLAWDRFSETK